MKSKEKFKAQESPDKHEEVDDDSVEDSATLVDPLVELGLLN